jgi:uncharacterized lipoprotein YajG
MTRATFRFLGPLSAALLVSACAAAFAVAQSQQAAPPPSPSQAPAPEAKPAASSKDAKDRKPKKKVWTEDDIHNLNGDVSVVGGASSASGSARSQIALSSSDGKNAPWYRNKLAPLRAQIGEIDRQILQMKSTKGTVRENVDTQVQILETKRGKLQAQIDDIEDDARRHGIEPGDLR